MAASATLKVERNTMHDTVTDNLTGAEPRHKTVSPRQLAANRANAQKSTGPVTSSPAFA